MPREYRYGIPDEYNFDELFLLAVAGGQIPGWAIDRKFGKVENVQADTAADVWEYGTTSGAEEYTWSTSALIDTISSSNTNDTQQFTIVGLDTSFNEHTINANLEGQDKVVFSPKLYRINRVYNSNGTPTLGNVYVYEDTTISGGIPVDVTKVRGYVSLTEGQTLQSVYTVPCSTLAFFLGLEVSLTKGVGATVVTANCRGRTKAPSGTWRTRDEFNLMSVGSSSKTLNFPVRLPFEAGTDFRPTVDVSADGLGISWAYSMLIKCPGINT